MKKLPVTLLLLLTSSCVPAHFEASASWGDNLEIKRSTEFKSAVDTKSPSSVIINNEELEK